MNGELVVWDAAGARRVTTDRVRRQELLAGRWATASADRTTWELGMPRVRLRCYLDLRQRPGARGASLIGFMHRMTCKPPTVCRRPFPMPGPFRALGQAAPIFVVACCGGLLGVSCRRASRRTSGCGVGRRIGPSDCAPADPSARRRRRRRP
ncbi:DUF6207 family protein [Streptomyces coeruleorubidus]|uniref:DUF6207 family protein n=1 Tax=Streptomyces coeruleorubidus TaxID=116188 RepID=UPI0037996304